MPTVRLSFLDRRKIKQVCRVCHEIAELKSDRLCAECVWIKAQLQSRFPDAIRRTIAKPTQQLCKRPGCLCAACSRRTLDVHPVYPSDPARADGRELHFHSRCHELWLEMVFPPPPDTTSTLVQE